MWLRRNAMLVGGVLVVALLGGVAAWADRSAARDAQAVHARDRDQQQLVLGGLTGQYLKFTFLATDTAARTTDWSLRPGDVADVARLREFAQSSPQTRYGAALLSTTGSLLSAYPSAQALPPSTDPGYAPLRTALLAHQPGLSSVLQWRGTPLVAFAVAVNRDHRVAAVFVAFADARTWPLEGYVRRLDLGATARPYTLDSTGTIAAAKDPAEIGRRLDAPTALTALAAGRAGSTRLGRDGRSRVVTYAPAGVGGWSALSEQATAAFEGPLPRQHDEDILALLALLTVAVVVLVVFHHTRQGALQAMADSRLYDPVTHLGQRTMFDIRLEASLAKFKRTGSPLALFYCDLDEFKKVNDRFGHNAGDELLRTVAERLRAAVRDEDAVVRMGGDEFAVIVEGVATPSEAAQVAARIRSFVCAPTEVAGEQLSARISIGGALLIDPLRADELLHEADVAMYIAKAERRRHHISVLGFPVNTP